MPTKQVPISKTVKLTTKRRVTKKPTAVVLENKLIFVLDGSGSMSWLSGTLVKVTNGWLDKVESESNITGQKTTVSRIDFSSRAELVTFDEPIADVNRLKVFRTGGGTALFDAVTMGIKKLEAFEKKTNTSMLCVTITDGEENSSSPENVRGASRLMKEKQATGVWTFVYMVPPGAKRNFCSTYDIPLDNVIEWEATEQGLRAVEESTNEGFTNYFNSRARGLTAVSSFYAQTDLSGLKPKEVKAVLTDVQTQCKVFEVPKEVDIAEFVTDKVGTYRAKDGKAYYQLTKREEVQPAKQILIMEKGKRAIYSGQEARELIGLHLGATDKVTPGNHANYDIFINSTSNNRKLVRGTKLIVKD